MNTVKSDERFGGWLNIEEARGGTGMRDLLPKVRGKVEGRENRGREGGKML